MIMEWLQYGMTPVRHPAARRLGYLYESIALTARYQRCRAQWQPHYEQCRQAILTACEGASGGRILIMGSGLLQDVPLEALNERFDEIWLTDLVWLWSARRRAARFSRVKRFERDVTESLRALLRGELAVAEPAWALDHAFDVVVSLNLVKQLPLLPARWLMSRGVSDEAIDCYGRALMRAHLDYLRRFQGARVCLIADRRIMERDRTGRQTDGIDPWWGLTPPEVQQRWWWEAVPPREGRGFSRRHQVGVSLWRNG